ncbi:methyl-coenzyme M reductase, subunit delta [Methanobrevibacter arboriphilus JCM 13429 = DSM 1125]|uniref:Methyl-coenzyme M reductase, subunit delta n=1 Tax=Methanobrevibacter arboriphilus JCM 13429 = DSM 1125 TaxID=1300164 RepID=A0A1V6N4G6_METAZ|nr:methyl-coenzyme M reductase operon protein D [Methanobrevibacter arboriphilus]OQD59598.1 methyl-coenzyme M reductase, subunit delta [Methanobrevibacter arboriphilus JCM 13429 = DSM 1125]
MDIEVFPHRVLGADTTEKLLNGIESLDDVKRTVIQGPRLPPEDPNEDPRYVDRRKITVNGKELELKVKTGRIFVEISNESTIDDIREICNEYLPFGFDINIGKYIRTQKTVSDNIKYGDADIPEELIGMTDQSAKLADRVTIIKKDKD